ncbi:MAG: hypothetical protein HT580_14105 [Dechloromonas sp.]|nr:MAG: hypothetical protein HT580_14105 [Dechloromonas sp.]
MIDVVATCKRGMRELIVHIDFPLLLITAAIMGSAWPPCIRRPTTARIA